MNFGWTGVIAKPLLFALQWLHRYIPNWGWAIVALTLVINFAVFPLKMKSWRSMQDMQKLAPEMRAISDKYKKYSMTDPRKKGQQEEMAELYQRHGINPMAQLGGCVPMLIQMPIWWALWRVLTGAIELRHAPVRFLDSGSFGQRPLLHFAGRHGHHHVFDDQDDAAIRGHRSVAAENDEAYAADVRGDLFHLCKRLEPVYVHQQPGGRRAAILFEPYSAAAHEQPIQE